MDRCMKALGVSYAELEDPRWLMLDSGAEQRCVRTWAGVWG